MPSVAGKEMKGVTFGSISDGTSNTALFADKLPMNATGYLIVEEPTTRTTVPGVFACGDATDPIYRQAVTAAGSGCKAAIDAERWLEAQEA